MYTFFKHLTASLIVVIIREFGHFRHEIMFAFRLQLLNILNIIVFLENRRAFLVNSVIGVD